MTYRRGVMPTSSPKQVQAASGAGVTANALGGALTCEILFHTAGRLVYVNRNGDTVTHTIDIPAGPHPIEAASITSNTCDITCFLL